MSEETLPDVILTGKGLKMTFLRDGSNAMRGYVSGEPGADTMYVPPHWHENYDEFVRVVKGKMEIKLGSTAWKEYTPEDEEVKIPRRVIHTFRTQEGVECIFDERTEPNDGEKELFFRNLLGNGTPPADIFEAMLICYHGDTMPGFPGHILWLERAFVTIVGGYIAPLLGYKRAYETLKKT